MQKNSHCSYCGTEYANDNWPRHCEACKNDTWRNPLPVTVTLCAVYKPGLWLDHGLVLVRRAIEPHVGELALPGGYLDVGETWEQGAVRELREETGIDIPAKRVWLRKLITAPSNSNLLIFCNTLVTVDEVPEFVPNNEVSELVIAYKPVELAFPTHTELMKDFFTNGIYYGR